MTCLMFAVARALSRRKQGFESLGSASKDKYLMSTFVESFSNFSPNLYSVHCFSTTNLGVRSSNLSGKIRERARRLRKGQSRRFGGHRHRPAHRLRISQYARRDQHSPRSVS